MNTHRSLSFFVCFNKTETHKNKKMEKFQWHNTGSSEVVSFLAETFNWNMHSLGSTQRIFRGVLDYFSFPVTQLVKNPPAMWETWVHSLGWEDPLEKGKATHSSILAWEFHGHVPCALVSSKRGFQNCPSLPCFEDAQVGLQMWKSHRGK